MKKLLLIVLALVLMPVVSYPIMYKYNIAGARMWGRRDLHEKMTKTIRTEQLLSDLAFAIQMAVFEHKTLPPQNTESMTEWLEEKSDWFKLVRENRPYMLDSSTGAMVDAWGIPIYLRVDGVNSHSLISFGPNRKDNNGKRDDMVYEFDPFEYVDKDEIN